MKTYKHLIITLDEFNKILKEIFCAENFELNYESWDGGFFVEKLLEIGIFDFYECLIRVYSTGTSSRNIPFKIHLIDLYDYDDPRKSKEYSHFLDKCEVFFRTDFWDSEKFKLVAIFRAYEESYWQNNLLFLFESKSGD